MEGLFGGGWCGRLRAEIEALRQAGALHLNSTHLVRGGKRQLLEKANIWESELMQEVRSDDGTSRASDTAMTWTCGSEQRSEQPSLEDSALCWYTDSSTLPTSKM